MAVVDSLRGLPFLGDECAIFADDAVRTPHEAEPFREERPIIENHGLARAEPEPSSAPHCQDDQEEAQEPYAEGNAEQLAHSLLTRTNARRARSRATARSHRPSDIADRDRSSKATVRAWNSSPRTMAAR